MSVKPVKENDPNVLFNISKESHGFGDLEKHGKLEGDKSRHDGPKSNEKMSKLEARKQHRAARAAKWKELMDANPNEKYEDPQDLAAIRHAQLHMGDYKLKSSDNYIVPENERIDAEKKKKQIFLLRESVNTIQIVISIHLEL